MKLKRFLAVSAACAVAAAGISVQVGAAGRFRLLTEPMSTVDGAKRVYDIFAHGDNLPMSYHNDDADGMDGLFDITADDLDTWRETGEFSYTPVESNFDFDRDVRGFNDCPGMCYLDAEGKIAERFAVRYDGKGKLDITKQSEDYFFPTVDGWILEKKDVEGEEQSTLTITATSPDGKTISKEIQYDTKGGVAFVPAGDYLAYIMYATDTTDSIYKDSENWGEYDTCFDVRVDALTKDGELKNIYTGEKPTDGMGIYNFGCNNLGEDYFAFIEFRTARSSLISVFFSDTGEIMTINSDYQRIDMSDYQNDGDETIVNDNYFMNSVEDCWGKNVILSYSPSYTEYGPKDKLYRLARDNAVDYGDVSISDTYKNMSTEDGELYLVQTLDDKWGFMNADGELLATYDDAGSFIGKYAPVIKDGKAFLINRDFKRVSEKIDAESVATMDKGLYRVKINGEYYFMTYAEAQEEQTEPEDKPEEPAETTEPSKPAETSEPSEPVEPEQPDTPSEPVQTAEAAGDNSGDNGADKTNPDTGAASAAAVLGLGVIAAGAVILSRKRG